MTANGRPQSLIRGVLLMWAGFGILPIMDASAKDLVGQGFSPAFVAWSRFALSTIILAPVLLKSGAVAKLVGPEAKMQIVRGVLVSIATVLFFSALATMPLADALAVYFVYPFLITVMAAMFLGERLRFRRVAAVLVGFSGTLLIVRPGFETVPVGVYYVLAAAVCFAGFNVLTRRLSGASDPWLTVFYQSLVGAVILVPFAPLYWQTPDLAQFGLFMTMILAGVLAHWLIVCAFDWADASALAPFGYAELISAAVIGYYWFGDFPDAWTWAGIAVIATAGVYIALRERKAAA